MILTNDLQAKWQPVLEHADLPKIDGAHKRSTIATLLENQERAAREQSGHQMGAHAPSLLGEAAPVNAMGASSTVNDKLNVLIYFESIILNSNVANRLINSAFMSILLKLLKNVKSPHLKMRLCSILGQLVRHSTVIGNDVAESGLC